MALSNYSDLQQAVANFTARDDLGGYIPDFIALAEARIATDLEISELHTTDTLAVDAQTEALPADYKGMVSIRLNGDYPTLSYVPPDQFHSIYASNTTGRPIAYTVEGNNILFAPTPDGTYTATYTYIQQPDLATDTTNRLMTIAPNVYLFAALVEAADFIHDEEMLAKYEARYVRAMQSLNDSDQNKGPLSIKLSGVV